MHQSLIPITDTHQHLIHLEQSSYSWTNGLEALEGRSFDSENYRSEIEGTGVTRTIFMETSPDAWSVEAGHIYSLAEKSDGLIAGVVANARPEEEGFEAYLDSIQHPKLVGLRRICHVESDEFPQQPRFVENIRRLGRLGLTFDLCFLAGQLPFAAELARNCPGVQMILDHCGGPNIAEGSLDPWRDHICKLAAHPNVACKISGIIASCRVGHATTEAVRPYVEHCLEHFGWDRVVWGGDWPVCTLTSTLRQWVAISRELVKDAAAEDQHKLFHENAARIYRLESA